MGSTIGLVITGGGAILAVLSIFCMAPSIFLALHLLDFGYNFLVCKFFCSLRDEQVLLGNVFWSLKAFSGLRSSMRKLPPGKFCNRHCGRRNHIPVLNNVFCAGNGSFAIEVSRVTRNKMPTWRAHNHVGA